ncbi:hypothetical protein HMPREF9333_00200 [Johnsonella ignava ATCC 51276]|uniref:Uncharacterized protein n=1 Tax=Johnsonella ignava ATCC 51276 TaxID=679200 RepID=G5GF62_9FIRM|nr:2-hydroxyacid dehydrogenase [Johnsonella ignava]EHI56753.1 hypothetical protein HMPREF9333_00200 [Johnsonella ignava ATCC 51276]
MFKVKCTFPEQHVEKFGKNKPEGFEFEYVKLPCSDEELIEKFNGADIIFCGPVDFIRRDVIKSLPNLKLIQSLGVGYDKIDLEAAKENSVYVCNNRAVNAASVAEHAVLLMLACLKNLAYADSEIKNGKFNEVFKEFRVKGHTELGGKTVGLVGVGAIGKSVVKFLNAFGCKLMYTDVIRCDKEFEEKYNLKYTNYDELYEKCDILSYHVPVQPETIGLVNKNSIAKMKDNVIIINVARGEIVNNEDLAEALNSGKVIAGLDVIAPEPPEADHPLFRLTEEGKKRLTMTPHMAGTTDDAFMRMYSWSYENMRRVKNGEKPNNIVNGL